MCGVETMIPISNNHRSKWQHTCPQQRSSCPQTQVRPHGSESTRTAGMDVNHHEKWMHCVRWQFQHPQSYCERSLRLGSTRCTSRRCKCFVCRRCAKEAITQRLARTSRTCQQEHSDEIGRVRNRGSPS